MNCIATVVHVFHSMPHGYYSWSRTCGSFECTNGSNAKLANACWILLCMKARPFSLEAFQHAVGACAAPARMLMAKALDKSWQADNSCHLPFHLMHSCGTTFCRTWLLHTRQLPGWISLFVPPTYINWLSLYACTALQALSCSAEPWHLLCWPFP